MPTEGSKTKMATHHPKGRKRRPVLRSSSRLLATIVGAGQHDEPSARGTQGSVRCQPRRFESLSDLSPDEGNGGTYRVCFRRLAT